MMVSLGKRRAMPSRVVGRMRSTLMSEGMSGCVAGDDAGMEKEDHPVLLRALIDGPIAPVVVILERAGEFPQPAETRSVEAVNEVRGQGDHQDESPPGPRYDWDAWR